MDYGKEVAKMLEHLGQHPSPEALTYFVRCLSFGLAHATTFVNTIEVQEELLECIFDATRSEAKAAFKETHPMTDTEFLRDYFNPEKFNG
jgi:hypothetical protein